MMFHLTPMTGPPIKGKIEQPCIIAGRDTADLLMQAFENKKKIKANDDEYMIERYEAHSEPGWFRFWLTPASGKL